MKHAAPRNAAPASKMAMPCYKLTQGSPCHTKFANKMVHKNSNRTPHWLANANPLRRDGCRDRTLRREGASDIKFETTRRTGHCEPAAASCQRPYQQMETAHAGSRTRVTSMGGLYDAATLRARTQIPKQRWHSQPRTIEAGHDERNENLANNRRRRAPWRVAGLLVPKKAPWVV